MKYIEPIFDITSGSLHVYVDMMFNDIANYIVAERL